MGQQTPFFPCQKEAYSYYAFWVVRQRLLLFFKKCGASEIICFSIRHYWKGVGGVEPFAILFSFSRAVKWPLYVCAHTQLVQQQDVRCTTNLATWWWWWLVGTHKYSSIIIGLYDPSFSLSLFVRSFFFFFFCLFEISFSSFLLQKRKEKRETLLIFECVRVCCHSRAPASPLWIFLWTRRRAIGSIFLGVVLLSLVRSLRTSAVPTHTQEGKRRRDTRVWPLFFFQKGAIQNGNDLRAEEEEAQNVSTPGQVRPRVKYRRRIIIWMGIDIALYSPGGFWRWWAWQSRHL